MPALCDKNCGRLAPSRGYGDVVDVRLESGGTRLKGFLAKPSTEAAQTHGLVICPAFPGTPGAPPITDESYAELAGALAGATHWTVLAFDFGRPRSADGAVL